MLDRTRQIPATDELEERWQQYLQSLRDGTRRPTPRAIALDDDSNYSAAQGSHYDGNWGKT